MIPRLLCVLVLVALIAGTVWYFFRDTPQKRIQRWRETSEALFREQGDIHKAEELNRRILELMPHSVYDLVFSATLNERKGTEQGLAEALSIYDKLIARGDPRLAGLCLSKSRVLRALGRHREAEAVARSILDTLPFEANLNLGETALSARNPRGAVLYFAQALRHAQSPLEKAAALEGQADAYWMAISAARNAASGTPTGDDLAQAVEASRRILREAYRTLVEQEERSDTKDRIRVPLAGLAEKLARLRTAGESPYWDTAQVLRERVERDEKRKASVLPVVYAQLGNLYLQTLLQEIDALDDNSSREIKEKMLRDAAQEYFLKSLGNRSPAEGKALVLSAAGDDRLDHDSAEPRSDALFRSRSDYVLNLLAIAKVYLNSTEFRTILDDPGGLALAARIADASESPDPEVASSFSVVIALAHLKSGETARAEKILDSYLAGLSGDTAARAALELAAQCHRMDRGSPLVFKYIDTAEKVAPGSLHFATRRLRLLRAVGENSDMYREEASRRIERIVADGEKQARTLEERVYLAELLIQTRGYKEAIESILQSPEELRAHPALHQLLAALLTEHGVELARADKTDAALESYRSALAQYLKLFISNPAQSPELTHRTVFLLRGLMDESPELSLEPLIRATFPGAPEGDRERFGTSLQHLLLGEFEKALEVGALLAAPDAFQPFWSYLTGTCHLQLSTGLKDAEAARRQIELARQAYDSHPRFDPNEIELIGLELRRLEADTDVPDELLERIESLKERSRVFEASWLLARALDHRFRLWYPDRDVKNSKVARVLQGRQAALREALRQRPRFTPLYIELADSFLISERLDAELRRSGSPLERKLFSADYERAILVLEAVPEPNARVMALAAAYTTALGKPQRARAHLETLCLVEPGSEVFARLLANYLSAGTNRDVELVVGERDPIDTLPAAREWGDRLMTVASNTPELGGLRLRTVLAEIRRIDESADRAVFRETLLSVLRDRFLELPDHQGMAHSALGQMYAVRSALSRLETDREEYREKAIAKYEEAVRAFDQRNLPVPLQVLNNLAWILVDGPDASAARLTRGLEVAERARDALENPLQFPDAIDTYAWALYRNRRLIEAEAELRGLLASVESPTYRYHLACILAEMKRFGEAHDEAQRALETTGGFPEEDEARALMSRMRQARIEALGETAMSAR